MGGRIRIGEYELVLVGFDKDPDHPQYRAEEGDIAVAAQLGISHTINKGYQELLEPVFLIREGGTYNVKA